MEADFLAPHCANAGKVAVCDHRWRHCVYGADAHELDAKGVDRRTLAGAALMHVTAAKRSGAAPGADSPYGPTAPPCC